VVFVHNALHFTGPNFPGLTYAYAGSVVVAESGSVVYAFEGSIVYAMRGSYVADFANGNRNIISEDGTLNLI
jgi:hypothetical protein